MVCIRIPLCPPRICILSVHPMSMHLPTPILQTDFQSHSLTGKMISHRVFFLPSNHGNLNWQNKTNCLCRTVKKLYALEYSSCHRPLYFPRHLASSTGIISCRTEKHTSKASLLLAQQNHTVVSTLPTTHFAWRPFFSGMFQVL